MPEQRLAQCACGSVQLQLQGAPIHCLICYCDDCQAGGLQIQALSPPPGRVLDADGGSDLLMYHRKRMQCVRGVQLLKPLKLRPGSATNRVVAACCNSAMYLCFDDRRFWVDIYRARLQKCGPPVQQRIFTSFMRDPSSLPRDVASHPK